MSARPAALPLGSTRTTERGAAAGDGLLHPAVVLAIGLLLVNDHLLKSAWPGWVTGKLSDVAGLAFFPVLLVAAVELASRLAGRSWRAGGRAAWLAMALTGLGFTAVKTVPDAAAAFGWMLGWGQWLLALPVRLVVGEDLTSVHRAAVVVDPSDLVALVALGVPLWVARGRSRFEDAP